MPNFDAVALAKLALSDIQPKDYINKAAGFFSWRIRLLIFLISYLG